MEATDVIEYPRDPYDIQIEDLHSKTQILRLVSSSTTIKSLINKVSDILCLPPHEIRLNFRGQELSNFISMTIKEVGILEMDTLRLRLRLKGGGHSFTKSLTNLQEEPNYKFKSSSQNLLCPLLESYQENLSGLSHALLECSKNGIFDLKFIVSKSDLINFIDQKLILLILFYRKLN